MVPFVLITKTWNWYLIVRDRIVPEPYVINIYIFAEFYLDNNDEFLINMKNFLFCNLLPPGASKAYQTRKFDDF